jgi:hypothetical protein
MTTIPRTDPILCAICLLELDPSQPQLVYQEDSNEGQLYICPSCAADHPDIETHKLAPTQGT